VQHASIKRSRHNEQALQRMRFIDALNLCDANDRDHPVAASDAVKCEKQTTATRRASLCSPLLSFDYYQHRFTAAGDIKVEFL
jgi:hypothetical protein